MLPLRRHLTAQDFTVYLFGYPSVRARLEENAFRLSQKIASCHASTVHLIGHSLGGLVILQALNQYPTLPQGRVVLLGTPCCGSFAAAYLSRYKMGRVMVGKSLCAQPPSFNVDRQIGVIAGTLGLGLGSFIPGLPRPNDGVVAVEETIIPGLADHIRMKVSHTGMLFSKAVARQVAAFLEHGCFIQKT
jgi:pimeloyl-ACP methyl ester carboxylesterase